MAPVVCHFLHRFTSIARAIEICTIIGSGTVFSPAAAVSYHGHVQRPGHVLRRRALPVKYLVALRDHERDARRRHHDGELKWGEIGGCLDVKLDADPEAALVRMAFGRF